MNQSLHSECKIYRINTYLSIIFSFLTDVNEKCQAKSVDTKESKQPICLHHLPWLPVFHYNKDQHQNIYDQNIKTNKTNKKFITRQILTNIPLSNPIMDNAPSFLAFACSV